MFNDKRAARNLKLDMIGDETLEYYEEIARRLETWCAKNCRRYPWRETNNPYIILITEFLLQRTKADTVVKVFDYMFSKYKTVQELALAKEEDLRSFFDRLGLVYRSERVLETAKEIIEKYGGKIPCDMEKLLSLKGVGVYMASAVLNFGCNQPTPVVDKNVMRVMNRVFNVISEREARRVISILYRYGDHRLIAYALIDLGALLCKETPQCNICPLKDICPKHPLRKNMWRMLRKVSRRGKVNLEEQPVK